MTLNDQQLRELCETATQAAIKAGKYIQSNLNKSYETGAKQGVGSRAFQVVTEIDIKAQEIILDHLQESIKCYDFGLLTEESADDQSRLNKSYFWCVDPLDGTLPFTEGRTGYAVSIALVTQSGDPIIGIVYVPDSKTYYSAIKGKGVLKNNETFDRSNLQTPRKLNVFTDISLKETSYYHTLMKKLRAYASRQKLDYKVIEGYGAVCNALGVMNSYKSCYFKYPKKNKGGGSIWDFAATRLFFEELNLQVSNAKGVRLNLNNPNTTFMNGQGILYATDQEFKDLLIQFENHIK